MPNVGENIHDILDKYEVSALMAIGDSLFMGSEQVDFALFENLHKGLIKNAGHPFFVGFAKAVYIEKAKTSPGGWPDFLPFAQGLNVESMFRFPIGIKGGKHIRQYLIIIAHRTVTVHRRTARVKERQPQFRGRIPNSTRIGRVYFVKVDLVILGRVRTSAHMNDAGNFAA